MSFYFGSRNRNRHGFGHNPLNWPLPNITTFRTQPMNHYHTASQSPPSSFKGRDGTKWKFLYEEILNQEEIQHVPSLAERFAEKQTEGIYGDLYIKEETCFEETDPMFVENLVNEIVMVNGVYRWYRTLSRTNYTQRIFRKYRKRFVFGRADSIPSTMSNNVKSKQGLNSNEESTNIQCTHENDLHFSHHLNDDLKAIKRMSSDMSANETDIDYNVLEPITKRYITEIRLPSKQERFKTEIENRLNDFEYDNESPVMRCAPKLLREQRSVQYDTNGCKQQNEQNEKVIHKTGFPSKHMSISENDDLNRKYDSNNINIDKMFFDTYGKEIMGTKPTSTCYQQTHFSEVDMPIFTDHKNQISIIDSSSHKRGVSSKTLDICTDDINIELERDDKTASRKKHKSGSPKRILSLSKNSDEIPHKIPRRWHDGIATASKLNEISVIKEHSGEANFVREFADASLNKDAHELHGISVKCRYSLPCKSAKANRGRETLDFSNNEVIATYRPDIKMKTRSLDNVIEWHMQPHSEVGASSFEKYPIDADSSNVMPTDKTANQIDACSCLNQIIDWHTQTNKMSTVYDRDTRTSLDTDLIVPISDDSGIATSNVWSIENCYEIVPNDVSVHQSDKAHTEFDIPHIPVEDIIDWHIRQRPRTEYTVNDNIESPLAELNIKTVSTSADTIITPSDSRMAISMGDDVESTFTPPQNKGELAKDSDPPTLQQTDIKDIINWHLRLCLAFSKDVSEANDKPKVLSDVRCADKIQDVHDVDDAELAVKLGKHLVTDKRESHLRHQSDSEAIPESVIPVQLGTSVNIESNQYFDAPYSCVEEDNQAAMQDRQRFVSTDVNEIIQVDHKSITFPQNENSADQLYHCDVAENAPVIDKAQVVTIFTDELLNYPATAIDIGQRLEQSQSNVMHHTFGKNMGQSVHSECESMQSIKCGYSPSFYDSTNEATEDLDVENKPVAIQTKDYITVCEQTVCEADEIYKGEIANELLKSAEVTQAPLSDQVMQIEENVDTYSKNIQNVGISKDRDISFSSGDQTEMLANDINVNSSEISDLMEQLYDLKRIENLTEKCNDDGLQKIKIEVCDQTDIYDVEMQWPLADLNAREIDEGFEKQDNADHVISNECIQSIIKWHFSHKQGQSAAKILQLEKDKLDASAYSKCSLPSESIASIVDWHLNKQLTGILGRIHATSVEDTTKSPDTTKIEHIILKTPADDELRIKNIVGIPCSDSVPSQKEDLVISATSFSKPYEISYNQGSHIQLEKVESVFANVRSVERLLPCGQPVQSVQNDGQSVGTNDDEFSEENKNDSCTVSAEGISSTASSVSSFYKDKVQSSLMQGPPSHLTADKNPKLQLENENVQIQFNSSHCHALFRTNLHRRLQDFLMLQSKNLAIDRSSSAEEMSLPPNQPLSDRTEGLSHIIAYSSPQLIAKDCMAIITGTERSSAVNAHIPMTARHLYSVQRNNLPTRLNAVCNSHEGDDGGGDELGTNTEPMLHIDLSNDKVSLTNSANEVEPIENLSRSYKLISERSRSMEPGEKAIIDNTISTAQDSTVDKPVVDSADDLIERGMCENQGVPSNSSRYKPSIELCKVKNGHQNTDQITKNASAPKNHKDEELYDSMQEVSIHSDKNRVQYIIVDPLKNESPKLSSETSLECKDSLDQANDKQITGWSNRKDSDGSLQAVATEKYQQTDEIVDHSINNKHLHSVTSPDIIENRPIEKADHSLKNNEVSAASSANNNEPNEDQKTPTSASFTSENNKVQEDPILLICAQQVEHVVSVVSTEATHSNYNEVIAGDDLLKSSIKVSQASKKRNHRVHGDSTPQVSDANNVVSIRLTDIPIISKKLIDSGTTI